jgi:23S rRNA (cytosine1962-C5)-methyltransferase
MNCDYELLDFGKGRRLERFCNTMIDRPCPAAEVFRPERPALWNHADARFVISSQNSGRGYWMPEPDIGHVSFGSFTLEFRYTSFGHVGLFPEQQENWQWITQQMTAAAEKNAKPIFVLNLFAYTGGSSLAAAIAGQNVGVVHVDAAQNVNRWAKRNAELNDIKTIRFIADDVRKFVRRELKRGRSYDAVILDPPSYGHGPDGEEWKLTEHLPLLLTDIVKLLSKNPLFILLTAHTPNVDSVAMQKMLQEAGLFRNGNFCSEKISMDITATTGKKLPAGCGIRVTTGVDKKVEAG